jgi:hypothetical protein
VPGEAVGATGEPVNTGLAASALELIAVTIALNSVSNSVPLIIFAGSFKGKVSLAEKLVDFV